MTARQQAIKDCVKEWEVREIYRCGSVWEIEGTGNECALCEYVGLFSLKSIFDECEDCPVYHRHKRRCGNIRWFNENNFPTRKEALAFKRRVIDTLKRL